MFVRKLEQKKPTLSRQQNGDYNLVKQSIETHICSSPALLCIWAIGLKIGLNAPLELDHTNSQINAGVTQVSYPLMCWNSQKKLSYTQDKYIHNMVLQQA